MSYTVRKGDTLTKIAAQFGTTWQAIAAANKLTNANLIRVGQVLTIPGASTGIFSLQNTALGRSVGAAMQPTNATTAGGGSTASPYAALRGDVIDFSLGIGAAWGPAAGYNAALTRQFKDRLNASGFQVVGQIDDGAVSVLLGGTMTGRVVINSNGYGNIADAAQVIGGLARNLGYNVQSYRAEHYSKARDGGGSNPTSINPDTGGGKDKEKGSDFDLEKILSHPITWILVIGFVGAKFFENR